MLYRAFVTVGGLTMVSRVLGFIRDILIAAALGTGGVADAFIAAFRLPNLFRRLFAEGAFNSAFVPLFSKRLSDHSDADAVRFANEAMSGLAFVLVIFSAIMILAMPWVMVVLVPGFPAEPAKYGLTVALAQIMFPYLFCMSLVALLSGVLNALQRFWAAAAAPIILNIVLIAAMVLAIALGHANSARAGYVLAVGVALAGFAQLAMLWVAVRRAGLRLSFRLPRLTDDMRRLVSLGIPGVIAGGVTHINVMVGTMIASLQAGAVSYLYYADRLYQLPLGIVGIAIGVVLLPELSRRLRAGDQTGVIDSQNRSLEFALLLTLPAAVALAVAASPIISVLFERGAFTAHDTPATAMALAAFAAGLPAFVMIKVFQPAFFAREDTRTPMVFATVNMLINVAVGLALFLLFRAWGWMPHLGIAVATTLAGWVNALLLWSTLARTGEFAWDRRLKRNLPLIALASIAMGVVLWLALPYLAPYTRVGAPLIVRVGALAALVAMGMTVYFGLTALTGAFTLGQLRRATGRRTS